MEHLSKSLEDTRKLASDFAKTISDGAARDRGLVVGLYGELGSGKTTFMKFFAESLGIKETIQSPTFVIMKRYGSLIHIDAYRIEDESELLVLGWDEMVRDPQNVICVEWPEKISGILPEHVKIYFEHVSENERRIKIEV